MPTDAKSSRLRTFFRRSGSTVGLWLLIGASLVFNQPILYFALLMVIVVLGLLEYFHLLHFKRQKSEATATIVIAVFYSAAYFWQAAVDQNSMNWGLYDGVAIAAILFSAFIIHLRREIKPGENHVPIMACVFGFIYIPYLFSFCVRVIFFNDGGHGEDPTAPGRGYFLMLIAATKFTDMGAYIVGSLIGKNKMIPHVSPGKTWEGTIGALGFTMLAMFGVTWLMPDDVPIFANSPLHTAILGFLIYLGAVVGDLAESILKRSLARKDSGHVMPGIGGVLDLIDSVIFTAPIFFVYLVCLAG